ncbi:MAG: glycosyltransferase [Erysipelotrichaceae bacterium]|mgnify:CR=1 FL=1|nr:glycosyltransferase [Erysipelotrichaceae bacterium]
MKIVFVSNFLNHHQLPLCNEFFNMKNIDFKFIATEQVPEDRLKLGYKKDFNVPYLLELKNKKDVDYAKKLIINCDIAIIGSCPYELEKIRIETKKIYFKYSERFLRGPAWRKYSPIAQYNIRTRYTNKMHENMFLLCASVYAAWDYNFFGAFKNKSLKWGYFTSLSKLKFTEIKKNKTKKLSLLWVGRMLELKHPEHAVEVAKHLKDNNIDYNLVFIGDGDIKNKIINLVDNYKLRDNITFLPNMSFEKVRLYMEKSNIFLFTSDFKEGWGAVLNEAMASGCAVVSSYQAGSTLFLIDKNETNGQIYDGTVNDLIIKVMNYINDKSYMDLVSKNAYETISNLWSPEIAAKRLVDFSSNLLEKKPISYYEFGPLSISKAISNKDAKQLLK